MGRKFVVLITLIFILISKVEAREDGIVYSLVKNLNCICFELLRILPVSMTLLVGLSIFLFILAHMMGEDYGKKIKPYAWALLFGALLGTLIFFIAPFGMRIVSPDSVIVVCAQHHC
jgi:hypothetical protein